MYKAMYIIHRGPITPFILSEEGVITHLVGFGKKNSKPCVLNAGNPGCQSHQPFVNLSSRLERHSHVLAVVTFLKILTGPSLDSPSFKKNAYTP